jgi:hypothetical protein
VRPTISGYQRGIAPVALETSRDLRLLPSFLRLIALVPTTVARLIGD